MIRHVVLLKFKPEASAAERDDLVKMLGQLAHDVETVRELSVGVDFDGSARACDLALIVDFDDREGLNTYAVHPMHIPVKKRIGELCEGVYVVDYELA
ncbi:MAG: Dabb family protein [Burkholderiales bacterium]|nr:Dabb family protein [Anaerolineae bacterium]